MDKTMEKEYKWRADEKLLGQALLWLPRGLAARAEPSTWNPAIFDTADGLLRNIRRHCVCAARTTAACAA